MAVVEVDPGESIQDAVDLNAAGTQYYLTAGTHRQQSVIPKVGDEFYGDGVDATFLTGARDITSGWVADGGNWKKTGATWGVEASNANCISGYRCRCAEMLFYDNVLLDHVDTFADPLGSGNWFFDYDNDVIYVGDNPAGATLIEQCDTMSAFWSTVDDIYIHDMLIEKYASRTQYGAVGGKYPSQWIGDDWICEDILFRYNHGLGLRLGNGMQVLDCDFLYNGQMGLGGSGDGVLYQGGELAHNNTAKYSGGWETGGYKFTSSDGMTIRNVHSHDNRGNGMWFDHSVINVLIELCTIVDNDTDGIYYEIGYDAVIRNNFIARNGTVTQGGAWGACGLEVHTSPNVEVYGNTLIHNYNSIIGKQQDRGSGDYGDHLLSNFYVHDNYIYMSSGVPVGGHPCWIGVVSDYGDPFSQDMVFRDNHYRLGDSDDHFTWGSPKNFTEWLAAGNDLQTEALTVLK
jgi:hypothetical protein